MITKELMPDKTEEILQRIARHLMLHSSFVNDCGLFYGKMGAVIFFFHYARHTGQVVYEDFAGELIEEIYEEINVGLPDTFAKGLCGIAWGFEYLIQQGFVEGDSNEVLEDLDNRILERDVRRIKNFDLDTGLKGLIHYVLMRCSNKNSIPVLLDRSYVTEMISGLKSLGTKDTEISDFCSLLNSILEKRSFDYNSENLLYEIIGNVEYNGKNGKIDPLKTEESDPLKLSYQNSKKLSPGLGSKRKKIQPGLNNIFFISFPCCWVH